MRAVGKLKPEQMRGLGKIAMQYGQNDIRLTVWQNLLVPHIAEADVPAVLDAIKQLGLTTEHSAFAAGAVACTAKMGCKYAATHTKSHAAILVEHLEQTFGEQLDTSLNLHLTGCAHSCAQHYIGDVGLLGASTADGQEAYQVFLGGGSDHERGIAQHLVGLVPADELPAFLEHVVPDDARFNPDQRQWLNGLLTGLTVLARAAQTPNNAHLQDAPAVPLTIAYGSQSGNCEALAKQLRKRSKTQGFEPRIAELNDLSLAELSGLGRVLIVCSTFGEGDPPDNAVKFCEALQKDDAPELAGLDFAVCGMGDSSYTHFNKTDRDLDARLEQLGAHRAVDFIACDVDYEDDFARWIDSVFASDAFQTDAAPHTPDQTDDDEPAERYTKIDPFPATVLEVKNLNGPNSAKEANHIELSLAGSGFHYDVGDALGLWPTNCPDLVHDVLHATKLTGREVVDLKGEPTRLHAALLNQLDLCTLTPKIADALGIVAPADDLAEHQVLDALEQHQPTVTAQQLADALRPLSPRLYSIASSRAAHPGEVHLTVGAVRYQAQGKPRKGVASTFLADRCATGSRVGVYLPPDDVPLIMIGPGTGIAPFRAFLEERQTLENKGKNWLFFGDQHEADDFLYRDEIQAWLADGTLERFDAAWSRDQADKIYVQHKMLEHGQALFDWLEHGAAVYVCGDASRMAKDVDAALHQLIAQHGKRSEAEADAYVDQLKTDHRYQRDVY